MILYFDSLIIDRPLFKSFVAPNDDIRKGCKNYEMPSRFDIARYTLASYASYEWSNVLIRYELNDLDQPKDLQKYKEFDEYILKLFPKALIMHERSDSQADFRKSLGIINQWQDDWIFYSGNNDHPIMANNISAIDKLLDKARGFKDKYKYISIMYSHFSEFVNLPRKQSPFNQRFGSDVEIIEEDNLAITIVRHEGDNSAIQIVNKNLLNHWFDDKEFGDKVMYRSEDTREGNITQDQLMIIPKQELCAHFDGYSHTMGSKNEITADQVPPLFIPSGFFENNIKIRYGYNDYKEGWTNINPAAEKYSFRDTLHGSDLMWTLNDIPLFWKSRISEIDSNPSRDDRYLKKMRDKKYEEVINPWHLSRMASFKYFIKQNFPIIKTILGKIRS